MNTKEKFQEMVAYDYSNLNVETVNNNCFVASDCDSRGCDCDICNSGEEICDNGTCNSYPD